MTRAWFEVHSRPLRKRVVGRYAVSLIVLVVSLNLRSDVALAACEAERQQLTQDLAELRRLEASRPHRVGEENSARRQQLLEEVRELQKKLASPECGGHPPPVSIDTRPDAILQALVCLPFNGVTADEVTSELRKRLDAARVVQPKLLPNPGVKAVCDQPRRRETVGIWRSDAGWESALADLDITSQDTAIFAIQFPGYSLQRLLAEAWQDLPKRYNDSGQAANDGSLHLTGYDLGFSPPDQEVRLVVHGTYQVTSALSISGDLTLIDRPSIDADGAPACTHRVAFDADANSFYSGFAFVPFPFNAPLIGETQSRLGFAQARVFANPDLARNRPGCLVTELVPSDIALTRPPAEMKGSRKVRPAAQKVVFRYDRVRVDDTGINFETSDINRLPHVEDRNAEIRWLMGSEVRVFSRDASKRVSVRAAIDLRDMRPPVKITWSISGGRVDSTPANDPSYALLSFPALPANRRTLDSRTQLGSISVRTVDADDLSVSASMTLTAVVVENPPPSPTPDPRKPSLEPVH